MIRLNRLIADFERRRGLGESKEDSLTFRSDIYEIRKFLSNLLGRILHRVLIGCCQSLWTVGFPW